MKQFQILALVLIALGVMGCATKYGRSETVTPYGETVAEHRETGYGDVVDIQKTTITSPAGLGFGVSSGYGPGGIPFLQSASLGEQAAGQLPQGTSYIVPMATPPQPTLPAQTGETASADDIAILAEAQLRMQRELDEIKRAKARNK